MINLNQLRSFHEAAKCQNFSQAARNLFVTQPAVTGQVRALEASLEIKLFQKRGRSMVLTEAGILLFRHAHDIFELEKKMEQHISEMRELRRGVLKIGTTKTYARYLMPSLISRFRSAYPEIKVILDEGSSSEISQSLLDLRNELVVVAARGEMGGMETIPFREEEVVLFAAPDHPLVGDEEIDFADLAPHFVIMKEQMSSTHKVVQEAFAAHGLIPKVLLETSNVDFIKEMVERGEGVSFLVTPAIESEVKLGRIKAIPIRDADLKLQVNIGFLNGEGLAPAAKAFLEILKGVGEEG